VTRACSEASGVSLSACLSGAIGAVGEDIAVKAFRPNVSEMGRVAGFSKSGIGPSMGVVSDVIPGSGNKDLLISPEVSRSGCKRWQC